MTDEDISEIVHLAWCDKTSFDEIEMQYGLSEPEVKALMRSTLKRSSFKMWRKRVTGRKAKHQKKLRPTRNSGTSVEIKTSRKSEKTVK